MKKIAILINTIVMVQFITLIVNVGTLRCQDNANIANTRYQVENMEKNYQVINEDNLQDDKNIRVRIIELIIKQNLNNRYRTVDSEELEDRLDKRR